MCISKSQLIEDSKAIGLILVVAYIVMQIAFYKQNIAVVAQTVVGLFYLFTLPLLPLTYLFLPQMSIYSRLLLSTGLSWASVTLLSYYLGLQLLNVNNHNVLPLALFIISGALLYVSNNMIHTKESLMQEEPKATSESTEHNNQ